MLTWRSMIGADAEPPSVQWSALVVSGDVLEITKFIVFFICITLTACGLYRNRCTPSSATQSQGSSSPNSTSPPPPSTEPIGIPGAVEILNSIEGSLENVLMSVVSSDNNTEVPVPASANSNMVVIEMASVALPA